MSTTLRRYLGFLVLFTITIGAATWCWHAFARNMLIERAVLKTCGALFRQPLSYESLDWDNDRLVLRNVVCTDRTEDGSRCLLTADALTIDCDLAPWALRADLHMTVVRPELRLSADEGCPLSLPSWGTPPRVGLIRVNAALEIEDGLATLETLGAYPVAHRLLVEGECLAGGTVEGSLKIRMGHARVAHDTLDLWFARGSDGMQARVRLQDVGGKDLYDLADQLGIAPTGVQIHDGMLRGSVVLTLLEGNSIPRIDGNIGLYQASYSHSGLGVRGEMEEVHFTFGDATATPDGSGAIFAQVVANHGLSCTFLSDNTPYWTARDVVGAAAFDWQEQQLEIRMAGKVDRRSGNADLIVSGSAQLSTEGLRSADLLAQLKADEDIASVKLAAEGTYGNSLALDIELQQLTAADFQLAQTLLSAWNEKINDLRVYGGRIDALLNGEISEGSVADLRMEHFSACELEADLLSAGIYCSCGTIRGEVGLDLLSHQPLDTLQADISVENGTLQLLSSDILPWRLDNINTRLLVRNGIVQRSQVEASLGGLRGAIELDWSAPQHVAHLRFEGRLADAPPFLPKAWTARIPNHLASERIFLQAHLQRRTPDGLRLEGQLEVQSSPHVAPILFGCELVSAPEHTRGERQHLQQNEPPLLRTLCPPLTAPIATLKGRQLHGEVGVSGMQVHNGWLSCERLPLDHYVSPLMFPRGDITLSGSGHLSGSFDHNSAAIYYGAKNVVLEGERFRITIPVVGEKLHTAAPHHRTAAHYFDFLTGKNTGFIPIAAGTYHDKTHDLTYLNTSGLVQIKGPHLYISDISTEVEGITARGAVNIDNTDKRPGYFEVDIIPETIEGSIPRLAQYIQHFNPNLLRDSSLSGKIGAKAGDIHLHLKIAPENTTLTGSCRLRIDEGVLPTATDMIVFHNIAGECVTDFTAQNLTLENGCANLRFSSGSAHVDYPLEIATAQIAHFGSDTLAFDVRMFDENKRELGRLAGTTYHDGTAIQALVNRTESHLFGKTPTRCGMQLISWSDLKAFELQMPLHGDSLAYELLRLSELYAHTTLGQQLTTALTTTELSSGTLNLSKISGMWKLSAEIPEIIVDSEPSGHGSIELTHCDGRWALESLTIGDLSAAADIRATGDNWRINFLGLRHEKMGLAGLEGAYSVLDHTLDLDINLLELDLAAAAATTGLLPLHTSGNLKATGRLSTPLEGADSTTQMEADLATTIQNFTAGGWHFGKLDIGQLSYHSGDGWTAEDANTTLLTADAPITLNLGMGHRAHDGGTTLNDLRFNIPADQLDWLSQLLMLTFPDKVSPTIGEVIAGAKENGEMRGTLSTTIDTNNNVLILTLADDTYHLHDNSYQLSQLEVECRPGLVTISSAARHQQADLGLWLQGSLDDGRAEGRLVLIDADDDIDRALARARLALSDSEGTAPLTIDWSWQEDRGWQIAHAKGKLSGLSVDLAHHTGDTSTEKLLGTVTIDGREAKSLLPDAIANTLERWKVGTGYRLNGTWSLPKEAPSQATFVGKLEGDHARIKGITVKTFSSNLQYAPDKIIVEDLIVSDPAGRLSVPTIIAQCPDEAWSLRVPEATLTDFSPSMLQKDGKAPELKPLKVTKAELRDLEGLIADETSLTGSGQLQFINPSKRNYQNTLLAIPNDIIARIGLDLDVLNPVTGTLVYEVRNGRVWLNELRDCYSAGRVSKFYLPTDQVASSVDLEGNLSVNVRMKQYNLLFKLAELFTVTIGGDLADPSYNLQQQFPGDSREREAVAETTQK